MSAMALSDAPGTIAATISNAGAVPVHVVSKASERDFDLHVKDESRATKRRAS
jgi:hypothetical protein